MVKLLFVRRCQGGERYALRGESLARDAYLADVCSSVLGALKQADDGLLAGDAAIVVCSEITHGKRSSAAGAYASLLVGWLLSRIIVPPLYEG